MMATDNIDATRLAVGGVFARCGWIGSKHLRMREPSVPKHLQPTARLSTGESTALGTSR